MATIPIGNFGQSYYWEMGETTPSRAPDLSAAWESQ